MELGWVFPSFTGLSSKAAATFGSAANRGEAPPLTFSFLASRNLSRARLESSSHRQPRNGGCFSVPSGPGRRGAKV